MRPTVHDIAAAAGVSLATVDRVLNGRPGVRPVTKAKVDAAIQQIGYIRDMAAANLAKGRIYPLVFIIPAGDNSFMRGLAAEIGAAMERSAAERTAVSLVEVPAFDADALAAALDKVRPEKPAGVAVVAVDALAVRDAAGRLRADGIPVVTLVSDLSGSLRDHYAGVDNIAAGRTAASLAGRFLDGRTGSIAVLAGSMLVRDHRERLEGFRSVMEADFPQFRLLPVMEGNDDPAKAGALVSDLLTGHGDLAALYSLGAGNRGVIAALKAHPKPGLRVIAHELTPHTRAALIDGVIDAVLNQDAGHEVRSAIRVLKAKADGMPVIEAQERIRIDIFLRDNLPFEPSASGTETI